MQGLENLRPGTMDDTQYPAGKAKSIAKMWTIWAPSS